jgi:hypothetical protein
VAAEERFHRREAALSGHGEDHVVRIGFGGQGSGIAGSARGKCEGGGSDPGYELVHARLTSGAERGFPVRTPSR